MARRPTEVEERLIDALHARRWDAVLAEMAEDPSLTETDEALVQSISDAYRDFQRRCLSQAESVKELLGSEGVLVEITDNPIGPDGQVILGIPEAEASKASALLLASGFVPQLDLSGGADRAYRRLYRKETLVTPEGPLGRLVLAWGEAGRDGLKRFVLPTLTDLRAYRVPGWLWWAYFGLRPARVAAERLGIGARQAEWAPLVATPAELARAILEIVAPSEGDLLIDLGCGDGRVLITAAQEFGCRGVGVESESRLVRVARERVRAAGVTSLVDIVEGDAMEYDVAGAQVVFAFLPPRMLTDLQSRVIRRLPAGGRLVTHEQTAVDWGQQPDAKVLVVEPAGVTVAYQWVV